MFKVFFARFIPFDYIQFIVRYYTKSGVDDMTPSRLFNHIIRDCFDGSIQYVNTKRQFLINQGTLMGSPMFQQYLQNSVHKDLDINQWINIEVAAQNRTAVGPEIMEKLRHYLHRICHIKSDETKSAINSNGTVSKQQTIKVTASKGY